MRRDGFIRSLVLAVLLAVLMLLGCTTGTIILDGRVVICTTCCTGTSCVTHCLEGG